MTTLLKQSTAVDVKMGPFLDSTDGNTQETALTITQPDIRLAKNGGAWAQKNAAQTLSHEEAGWYEVALDATDTNTLGILIVAVHEAGALPCWREFVVVPANVYDSLVGGSDALDVSLVQWLGSAPNALVSSRVDASVGAMAVGVLTANAIATDAIQTAKIQDGALTAAKFAADFLTAAKVASDVGTEIAAAVWAAATRTLSALGFTLGAADLAADTITAAKVAADVSAEIADAVWDEAIAGHLGAGSTGEKLNAAGGAGDPWTTALPGAYGAGSAGKIVGDNLNATVSSRAVAGDQMALVNDAIQTAKVQDGALTAAKFAADFLTAAKVASDVGTEIAAAVWAAATRTLSALGFVLGAGDLAADTITAAKIAPDAIGASELAADAVSEIAAAVAAPSAAAIADQVWDEALSGHLGAGSTGAKLNSVSGAGGAGAISWDVLVQVGVTPQQGVAVWVATDAAGANVVAGTLITPSNGTVTFLLDAGTYYAFARKDGLNPVVGQSFVVA